MWVVGTAGLQESCDHLFVVGYSEDRGCVEYLWLVPSSNIPSTSIRFAPGSKEYRWEEYEVGGLWGLEKASDVLQRTKTLPDPLRPGKYDWMDDPAYISGAAPGHKGRRAEILYQERYPRSWDVNRALGSGSPHDFEDPGDVRVNVKSSRRSRKANGRHKWSFSILGVHQVKAGHKCDVYACLALDESGETVLREFRIPPKVLGDRRVIHIYDPPGHTQWAQYEIRGAVPHLKTDASEDEIEDVVSTLANIPFPTLETPCEKTILAMFGHVRDFPMMLDNGIIGPWSPKGTRLCSAFFPNRYQARYEGEPSAYEAWHDPKQVRRAVRAQLRGGHSVTPYRVLRALCLQHRTPTVFKPTTARFIYERYCSPGGRVWDPCSGYGGRLLGALAAGVHYVGTDVEPETVRRNRTLAETLCLSDQVEVILERAEVFNPGPVDLVFTSPPYFDRERYSSRDSQSWVFHGKDFDSWIEGFLRPIIRTSRDVLNRGHLVLNVADIKKRGKTYPLVHVSQSLCFPVQTYEPEKRSLRSK